MWGAVAALTLGMVGVVAAPANAAPPGSSNAPVATASATDPVDDTVTVTSTVNRGAKQIRQPVSCTLDDVTVDCGTQTGSTKTLTSYSRDLTGLADGVHLFVVTFTLTDGGTAAASVEFTIDTPTLEETCATAMGGLVIYSPSPELDWVCIRYPYPGASISVEPFGRFCASNDFYFEMIDVFGGLVVARVLCLV